ncbi:MAG TPA: O-antigen ligase family protein [Xanthobacteraceae bacterium]|nr:O-antigen ligase family protein [Xanthobacteraceae bacterium]
MSAIDHAETPTALAGSLAFTPPAFTPANALADRFLHVTLYVTVVSSFFVFIEPAPYEYLAFVLGFACVLARVTMCRVILPLLVLLLFRDLGGAIGLAKIALSGWMRVTGEPDATVITVEYQDSIRFLAVSFYLGLTAVLFACILSQDTVRRMATLKAAYITAAVIACALGTIAYFQLIPGFDIFMLDTSRATGGFKTPNDFGGFLIAPLMWLFEGFIVGKIKARNVVATAIILTGLLLSFSRGAWGSTVLAAALIIYLLFVTQHDARIRRRIVFFVAIGAVVLVALLVVLSSIGTVGQMIAERSQLQDYDVNADNRSRFQLEIDSFHEMFNHPLGMGPWGFAHATNWVSHDTFLGTMLNHGWIGGTAYMTLIAVTLWIGFCALWQRAPWQSLLVASYSAFVALVLEGVWGDTDHWRAFYIVLGVVWGLVAATQKAVWRVRNYRAAPVVKPGVLAVPQNSGPP